jgi:hypothetical protein
MNVEKGTFQAIKPPNIYGNGHYLTDETNYIISGNINGDINIGKNKTIPLPGITNEYTSCINGECLQKTSANINYRLIENTLGFQYYKATKNEYNYTGLGIGIQNFPYVFFTFGYNKKSFEIGGAVFWGLAIDRASYEGWWYYFEPDAFSWGSDMEVFEYIKFKNNAILHSYGGLVAYTSFYWEKFALNYAASISNPWLVYELPADFILYKRGAEEDLKYANISFWFPALLMQDIGISYTPNRIKYRLGVNQITGVKFPGQYWGISGQMAYLF